MQTNKKPRLFSSRELAEKFDVTTRTVARWRRQGRIDAALQLPDRTFRYDYDAVVDRLRRWMRGQS